MYAHILYSVIPPALVEKSRFSHFKAASSIDSPMHYKECLHKIHAKRGFQGLLDTARRRSYRNFVVERETVWAPRFYCNFVIDSSRRNYQLSFIYNSFSARKKSFCQKKKIFLFSIDFPSFSMHFSLARGEKLSHAWHTCHPCWHRWMTRECAPKNIFHNQKPSTIWFFCVQSLLWNWQMLTKPLHFCGYSQVQLW